MMGPAHRGRTSELAEALRRFEDDKGQLAGLADSAWRKTLVDQVISSLRRIEFIEVMRSRNISVDRSDPNSKLFDPLRAAAKFAGQGKVDDAAWLTFIDLPPLKWSSLKYGLTMEELIDGKEEAYS